jgi:hypothetical protein
VDDRSNDPRYWRDKAASFRAQADTLLARAREFEDMAVQIEMERGADNLLFDGPEMRGRLSRLLLRRLVKSKLTPVRQPVLRVVR